MADQLCTSAQVKARVSPDGTWDAADDTLLSELIDEVSAWVQSYTGREFTPEAGATYVFDTQVGKQLYIARGIRAITSMGVNPTAHQPDTGGSYTTIPAAERILRPKAGDLPDGWPATEVRLSQAATTVRWFGNVENGCTITGDFGWAAVPKDIEAVTIDAVVAAYQSRRNGASSVMGAEDYAMPPWNRFFGRGSPQRGTLDRYRFVSV